jgi:hypothetical protein
MSGDISSLAAEMVPYMSVAASAYGGAVLARVRDDAADATVGLGRRLLQRVFGTRAPGEQLPEPLADVVGNPHDEDAAAALRLAVRKALEASPTLKAEVEGMLASAGVTVTASGERSISGQTISGIVTTGDHGIFVTGGQPQFTVNVGAAGAPLATSLTGHEPERVIQISSLLPPGAGSIIRGRTFEDASFVGPAVVAPLTGVTFDHCVFGFDKDMESILWEVAPDRFVVGVIGLERCTFRRCRFNGISFMGIKESIDNFRNGLGSAPQGLA